MSNVINSQTDPLPQLDSELGLPPSSMHRVSKSTRPAPRGAAAYSRKRAVTACQTCRARRTKCDNKKPSCSFCLKAGARCVTTPVDMSSFDPASLQILQKLDGLEQLLRAQTESKEPPENESQRAEDDMPSRMHLLPQSVEVVLNWPVFQNRFAAHLDLFTLLEGPGQASISTPASINSLASISELEPRSCLNLLDSFFRYIHVKNPILDEARTRAMVHRVCLEGVGWNSESCLVLLVCALGVVATPLDSEQSSTIVKPDDIALAECYFKAAQRRIGPMIGKSGVLEAQCLFLAGVFQSHLLQPIKSWRFFVQALACCQEFKFAIQSYDDSPTPNFRADGSEREACVYWTCWKSEREVRNELNLPDFKTTDYTYPRLYPAPPVDNEATENTGWYFYLAEISLRRLTARIRDEVFNFKALSGASFYEELSHAVTGFEAQVESWIQSLPPTMDLEDIIADGVLKFILRGHLNDCYEAIYWPFVEAIINRRRESHSTAQYASKGLQMHVERLRVNRAGFRHRHHGTWGMLRTCTRSALVLLAAVREPEASRLLPDDWESAVAAAVNMLQFWQGEVGDAGDRLVILQDLFAG